jgi:maltose O-acetyltransferase
MDAIRRILGKIFLKLRGAAEQVEIEDYLNRLASKGENVRINRNCTLTPEHIYVGNNVVIGANSCLMASIANIRIGNNVVMGPGVIMRGGDHRFDILGKYIIDVKDNEKLPENDADITIEDDVWIGQGAMILKGVTIGKGSVIGGGVV